MTRARGTLHPVVRIATRVATLVSLVAAPAAARQPDPVDAIFAPWNTPGSPGCAVAANKDGARVLERAYGLAHLDHRVLNTVQTVFETGSVAKQFAAAAILMLVDDGKLSLVDDVRRHVPELPDYGAVITIDHLLRHTSGLREAHTVAYLGGWAPTSEGELLDVVARQRSLNHAPGAQFNYVGAGYFLASVIVRRASGVSLAEFSRTRIFGPLGMRATAWRENHRAVVRDRATAYQPANGGYLQSMPAENVYGHGGLLTTVGDLLLWNDALAHGRLGPRVSAALHAPGRLADGRATGYGRGVFLGQYRGAAEISHDGGHGAYRAWLGWYPESRLSVALLCNTVVPDVAALARRVVDVHLPAPATSTVPTVASTRDPLPMTEEEAHRLAGTYLSDELGLPLTLTADGNRLRVDGAAAQRESATAFRAGGLELTFDGPGVLRLHKPSGERQTLRRVDGPLPAGDALQQLAGRYTSDEAVATYVVGADGDALVLRLDGRPGTVHRLTPIGRDVFRAPGMIVRVHREANGTVAALAFSMSRVRELRFERVVSR